MVFMELKKIIFSFFLPHIHSDFFFFFFLAVPQVPSEKYFILNRDSLLRYLIKVPSSPLVQEWLLIQPRTLGHWNDDCGSKTWPQMEPPNSTCGMQIRLSRSFCYSHPLELPGSRQFVLSTAKRCCHTVPLTVGACETGDLNLGSMGLEMVHGRVSGGP